MWTRLIVSGLVVAAGALVPASPASAATWSVVPTPNATTDTNRLYGLDVISATSAWAVGAAGSSSTRPIVGRWDGSAWSLTPTSIQAGAFNGVDGSGEDNVWAVGTAGVNTLTQRWNGESWTVVPSPTPAGATDSALRAVKVFDANNAWAVGDAAIAPGTFHRRSLIVRWNGATWSTVPSPSPDPAVNFLDAVDGTANDLWAVGNLGDDGYGGGTVAGMVLRWNGTSWTQVPIPGADSTFSIIKLHDIAVLASNDVWVVGEAFLRWPFRTVPYVLRWNGSTWQHGTIPNAPAGTFRAVTAVSPTEIYAAGRTSGSSTFVARWNGSAWTQESTPAAGVANSLEDLATAGTSTVVAVGSQYTSSWVGRTLALSTS